MKISKHFTLEELTESRTGTKKGINNTPTEEQIRNLQRLCTTLADPIRGFLKRPLRINSGYRCPELNKIVGGVINSVHTLGLACDMVIPPAEQREVMAFLRESNYPFDQAIAYPNRGFIHIGLSPVDQPRRELLLCSKKGKYEQYIF